MADQNTNTTNNDNLLMSYFERRLIKTLHEQVWFYQLAEKYPLPKGSGTGITFNGWRTIAAASSTLAESSANSAVSLSSRKVSATVASYGRAVKITELLDLTSIAGPQEGAIRELTQSAALTRDNIIQLAVFKNVLAQVGQNADTKTKILSAWMSSLASAFCLNTGTDGNSNQFGFPVVFGTSAARLSAVDKDDPSISARLGPIAIRKAVARLKRLNVMPKADGCYAGVAHPYALSTMYGNDDWKSWQKQWDGGPTSTMYKHEAGKVHQVRFMESTNVPRYAVAAHSVNLTFICGEGALGATELNGGVEMIVTAKDKTADPFQQYYYVAYKVRGVAAVLNPSAGVIVATHEKL